MFDHFNKLKYAKHSKSLVENHRPRWTSAHQIPEGKIVEASLIWALSLIYRNIIQPSDPRLGTLLVASNHVRQVELIRAYAAEAGTTMQGS